jgi:hypothetical protein
MIPLRTIHRWGIPVAGILLILGVSGIQVSRQKEKTPRRAPDPKPTSAHPEARPRGTGTALPPAPMAASVPLSAPAPGSLATTASANERLSRERIDESFLDLRLALILHDRALGEKAYPILRRHGPLALERARSFLQDAKDPADRDVAERAVRLLSAPPTHGLLKHYVW